MLRINIFGMELGVSVLPFSRGEGGLGRSRRLGGEGSCLALAAQGECFPLASSFVSSQEGRDIFSTKISIFPLKA